MSKGPNEIKFALLMSSITTFFVTLVLVLINYGYNEFFFRVWMRSWFIAFVMVTVAILYLAPVIRNFLHKK